MESDPHVGLVTFAPGGAGKFPMGRSLAGGHHRPGGAQALLKPPDGLDREFTDGGFGGSSVTPSACAAGQKKPQASKPRYPIPMKTPRLRWIALVLAASTSLPAQTVPPPAAADTAADPALVLDPFTINVESDSGYVAVDSLAGGRQNTPLRITPSAVSALTSEFIADTGATDLESALRWSLNAIPTNFRSGSEGGTGGDTHNFWSFSIRGDSHVQGGNPPTKNYFPTYMVIDTYNV